MPSLKFTTRSYVVVTRGTSEVKVKVDEHDSPLFLQRITRKRGRSNQVDFHASAKIDHVEVIGNRRKLCWPSDFRLLAELKMVTVVVNALIQGGVYEHIGLP